MKPFFPIVILGSALLLADCLATTPVNQGTRIDEVPMYGGLDRSKSAELKAADEKFIFDVTQHYGSREKAGRVWVEQGFRFQKQDSFGLAMRRFNQAWLLDPANPEVYAGFAAVLHDQGRNCEAMQMSDKTLALNPPTFQGIYTDSARIFTLCAVSDKTLSPEAKTELLNRSDAIYKKAEEVEPDKRYLYSSWATAYYWREQYTEAWLMVAKARAVGDGTGAFAGTISAGADQPGKHFLNLLRAKMTEPAQQ
jgi:tetratricopeptide (TPR) repeat protein